MKHKLFPIINKYTLKNININKYPWGWASQKAIKKIITNSKQNNLLNGFDEKINEKTKINKKDFEKGALQGYKRIYIHFLEKKDFLRVNYTTPELSNAINYINQFSEKKYFVELSDLEPTILTSWIEVGQANTNNNLFGLVDMDLITTEMKKSSASDLWDVYVGPLKQKVRVLYRNSQRYDVWEWEKCLMKEKEEWTVSNINEILK